MGGLMRATLLMARARAAGLAIGDAGVLGHLKRGTRPAVRRACWLTEDELRAIREVDVKNGWTTDALEAA